MPLEFKFGLHWVYNGERGGQELFHRRFEEFTSSMRNWAPAFRQIADDILTPLVQSQFETEGGAGGTSWQELAPSTMKYRKPTSILYVSGALLHSFIDKGGDHVEDIQPLHLSWGSAKPYALFHQTGTGKGYKKARVATGKGTGRGMPMRPIIALTDEVKQRMANVFIGRGAQIARQAGFAVTSPSERAGLSPLAARRIGETMLANL